MNHIKIKMLTTSTLIARLIYGRNESLKDTSETWIQRCNQEQSCQAATLPQIKI